MTGDTQEIQITLMIKIKKLTKDHADDKGFDLQQVRDFDLTMVDSDLIEEAFDDYCDASTFEYMECPNDWPWEITRISRIQRIF